MSKLPALVALSLLALSAGPARQSSAGVAAELSVDKEADTSSVPRAAVQLKLTSDTGQQLLDAQPRIWIERRRSEAVAQETACEAKTARLANGSLFSRADVDLSGFFLVTLNHSGSVSFIDPFVRMGKTQLAAIVPLPGRGLDWALSPDSQFLAVTIPGKNAVAVIAAQSRKLLGLVQDPRLVNPARIWIGPGNRAWVGLDGSANIAIVDLSSRKVEKTIDVGAGLHTLAPSSDNRFLLVSGTAPGRLSLIDTATRQVRAQWSDLPRPAAIAYSAAAARFYAASANSPLAASIDPASATLQSFPAPAGITAWRFEADGRFALALRPVHGTVHLFDASSGRFTAEQKAPGSQISFSRTFAIVRSPLRAEVTLLDLAALRKGELAPIPLSVGQDFDESPLGDIVADLAIALPDGPFTLIASLADRTLYTYSGNKIVGTHRTNGELPVGVMTLPKGATESAPGVYSALTPMPGPGRYDVLVKLNRPSVSFCFPVAWDGPASPQAPARPRLPKFVPADVPATQLPGATFPVRVSLRSAVGDTPITGLTDVRLLLTRLPDFQQRAYMVEVEPGVYEHHVTAPAEEGLYKILFSADSQNIGFHDSAILPLTVETPGGTK